MVRFVARQQLLSLGVIARLGSKTVRLFSRFLCDLEDLRSLIEPSFHLGFYIKSLSLLNHIEINLLNSVQLYYTI